MVRPFAKATRRRLHLLHERPSSEGIGRAEEELSFVGQTLEGGEAAVVRPIAVHPVVVAGREDGGRVERVEPSEGPRVEAVVANGRAISCLEVAVVDSEGQCLAVHVGDQVGRPIVS